MKSSRLTTTDPDPRFKRFQDVWPEGPAALWDALAVAGFEIDPTCVSLLHELEQNWEHLNHPGTIETATPTAAHFGYLAADSRTKVSDGWGLLLIEKKYPKSFDHIPSLRVRHADAAMDFILRKITAPEWAGPSHSVPDGVVAENGVTIGPDCEIGPGTVLETGVRLGARVTIGAGSRIGAHSRIADDSILGANCTLTGSVSIGGQGFGFVQYPGKKTRDPRLHVGRVIIGDRVRLGAFVAIDRGVIRDSTIGHETAIDNIVQIGHNAVIGSNGVFCSFVGLSGSTTVGDRVTLAAQVGSGGHLRIGNDVTVAGQSGVSCDIPDGQAVKGWPTRPIREALKLQVLIGKIPELFERVKNLEGKK